MLKRVTDIDAEYKCGAKKAIEKFFKRHPDHAEWKETFEWMAENGEEKFCDDLYGDGTKKIWTYCLWLDVEEGYTYIALIERA